MINSQKKIVLNRILPFYLHGLNFPNFVLFQIFYSRIIKLFINFKLFMLFSVLERVKTSQ